MNKLIRSTLLIVSLLISTLKGGAQTDSIDNRPQSTSVAQSLALEKNYGAAIRQYEQIIQTEPTSINYYNLAVCYAEVGRTKDAIVAYERALLIDPSLYQARHNLRLAYASTKDALGDGRSFVWLDNFAYALNISSLQILAPILFALLVACIILLWVSRRSGRVRRSQLFFGIGVAFFILWILDLALIAHQIYYHNLDLRRAIISQTQELRQSPTGQGNTVATLHEGTAVFLEGESEGSLQEVSLPDGRHGFVPESVLIPILPSSTQVE